MTFERLANTDVAYLTTLGRRTGRRHRIEIWFALDRGRVYLLAGDGERADWVKNIRKRREVRIQIGSRTVAARARFIRAASEDARARELLDAKYMDWRPGRRLSSWARGALPVRVDPSVSAAGARRTRRRPR